MAAPRIILYTGKGGVGKTSVAAATARRCAAAGLCTVVLSTDPGGRGDTDRIVAITVTDLT
jgi:arsenite-transporting ATPase